MPDSLNKLLFQCASHSIARQCAKQSVRVPKQSAGESAEAPVLRKMHPLAILTLRSFLLSCVWQEEARFLSQPSVIYQASSPSHYVKDTLEEGEN